MRHFIGNLRVLETTIGAVYGNSLLSANFVYSRLVLIEMQRPDGVDEGST